jgi:hypothetical protein
MLVGVRIRHSCECLSPRSATVLCERGRQAQGFLAVLANRLPHNTPNIVCSIGVNHGYY